MDTKKKNLIGLLVSLVAFIIVLVMFVAAGIGITDNSTTIKLIGWGNTSEADALNSTITFTDFDKIAKNASALTKGIGVFSILAFVFVLLFTVYFLILTIGSFMGKELMSDKARMITGLVLSIGLVLFAFLFMISSFTLVSDLNKNIKIGPKVKLTGVSYVTMFFPIIFGGALIYSSIKLV